jgi:hypothetical protein
MTRVLDSLIIYRISESFMLGFTQSVTYFPGYIRILKFTAFFDAS